tara:strand:- start:3051 stop:5858 length:2808 start_codon:yes stop_codon:yes gene_type:complete
MDDKLEEVYESDPLAMASAYGVDVVDPDETVEAAKSAAQFGWESLPGVGTTYTVRDITSELEKESPNYLKIGALAGAEVIGLIPGLGSAARSMIRQGAKSKVTKDVVDATTNIPKVSRVEADLLPEESVNTQLPNTEYDTRMSDLDESPDADTWQRGAKDLIKEGRVSDPSVKTPELEDSTRMLLENKITREEHLSNVDKYKPVDAWDALPREPSDKALVFALDSNKRRDGLFVLDDAIAEALGVPQSSLSIGMRYNGRLDIPAYTNHDTWIVAGTSPAVKTSDGKSVTTYAKAIHYVSDGDKSVKFIASEKTSARIGTGEANKSGYATVSGIVGDLDVNDIRSKAAQYLNDPEWTQVGFDPRRQGGFYVRAGENKHVPIREASEVIQIGPLVLARNSKLDFEHTGYAEGGVAMDKQMEMAFAEGGALDLDTVPDNTQGVDPVSGNEVPLGSMPEEVRDDIPAQLSEGEYVVPADVVRYYGVKYFEDLRAKAKFGYQDMEENGRIGGEPVDGMEVIEPEDDMMFDISELEVEDDGQPMEMASGGYALSPGDPGYDEMGALGLGSEGIGLGYESSDDMPTVEVRSYKNDAGHTIFITFINGKPQTTIPPGYTLQETTDVEDSTKAQPVAQVATPTSSGNDDPPPVEAGKAVNYTELTTEEIADMLEEQRSSKMTAITLAAGAINPIMGLFIKGAMMDSARRLENEIERRVGDEATSTSDKAVLEGLLKASKEDKPGLIKRVFGALKDEFFPENEEEAIALEEAKKKDLNSNLSQDEVTPGEVVPIGALEPVASGYTPTPEPVGVESPYKGITPEVVTQMENAVSAAAQAREAELKKQQDELDKRIASMSSTARVRREKKEAAARQEELARQRSANIKKESDDSGYSIAELGRSAAPSGVMSESDKAAKKAGATPGVGGQFGMKDGGLASKKKRKKK